MSKIICDVCGTRYPDTAEQCPICGHIRESAGKTAKDVLIVDDARPEPRKKVQGGRFSKENVQKRNAGTLEYVEAPVKKTKPVKNVETAKPQKKEKDLFAEDAQNQKANTVLNVLLVVVILALLAVTAFIFMSYILPAMGEPKATTPPTAAPTEPVVQTQPVETGEPTYPCEELVFEETEVLLTEYQQKWLIPVSAKPANTTDKLTFKSGNDLIVTVDSEGCLTALAEGQTSVTITCGNVQFEYNVVCLFPGIDIKPGEVPTDPPPTEPPVEWTVTTNYVYVRTGPSAEYDPVRQHFKGDKIMVYEIKDVEDVQWGRLEDGWLCLKYAKKSN